LSWWDSGYDAGWHYGAARNPLQPNTTFGVVTFVDEKEIEIASTVNERRGILNPLSIPIGCILEVKEL